jgi:hypothetical protein
MREDCDRRIHSIIEGIVAEEGSRRGRCSSTMHLSNCEIPPQSGLCFVTLGRGQSRGAGYRRVL